MDIFYDAFGLPSQAFGGFEIASFAFDFSCFCQDLPEHPALVDFCC